GCWMAGRGRVRPPGRRRLPAAGARLATDAGVWRPGGQGVPVTLEFRGPTGQTDTTGALLVNTTHLFVTGGVVSSLGKGLTASSLGNLLSARGLRGAMQKLGPCLGLDPGP